MAILVDQIVVIAGWKCTTWRSPTPGSGTTAALGEAGCGLASCASRHGLEVQAGFRVQQWIAGWWFETLYD